MFYKARNILVLASILVVGLSFGVSRSDQFDTRDNRDTFVCNKKALEPKSRETRQYNEDIAEQKRLTNRQTKLLSDTNVANNTCKKLKKKEQARCEGGVVELKAITHELKKIAKRISDYESCKMVPKCGNAVNVISAVAPTNNLCASGGVVMGVTYDPTTVDSNGNGMWTWRCGFAGSSTGDTCYAPRSFTYSWFVAEWGACVNSQQVRMVSCKNNLGQTVSNNNCTGSMPAVSQLCQTPLLTQIQSSHYNNNPIEAANMLADLGIIMNYSDRPSYYHIDETMNRAEYLGVILTTMRLMPTSDYQCQNIFSDVSEPWVCRVAETALANGLISKQTNEQGQTFFRGTGMLSAYEILVHNLKSQCIRPSDVSVPGMRAEVRNLGITNADTLNMSQVATRGDIYLSLMTFYDYFTANLVENPGVFDTSIPSCAGRVGDPSGDDEDALCILFPALCE